MNPCLLNSNATVQPATPAPMTAIFKGVQDLTAYQCSCILFNMCIMEDFIKGLHNLARWVVVAGGVWAIYISVWGLLTRNKWTPMVQRSGLIFTIALQLQFVLGIVLYLISPLVGGALNRLDRPIQSHEVRQFTFEHPILMLLALVAAQLGYSLSRRGNNDRVKFIRASIGFVIAGVFLFVGVPWSSRPLLPWG